MPTAFTTRERRRIIQLFQQGLQGQDVAEVMGASASGVRRVYQQYREEGRDTAAYANCGPKPTLDEAAQQTLRELARARPDAFCRELAEQLHTATGVRLSRQRVGVWLGRLGLTRKRITARQRAGTPRRQASASYQFSLIHAPVTLHNRRLRRLFP